MEIINRMKSVIISVMLVITTVGYSQTKKEYYDPVTKTKLMAEYQLNSSGEKDGWFKGYDQQGVLVYEYNFKNNLFHGVNTEYSTYSGKRELAKVETYENGVLQGRSKYYGQGGLVIGEGNFVQGKKNGKWFEVEAYASYDLSAAELKGFEYIAFPEIEWRNGERVKEGIPDGQYTYFFYPTKKPRSVLNFKNSKMVGVNTWYYPNGNIESKTEYAENGTLLYSLTLYPNGKTKEYTGIRDGIEVFEQYDENGEPTREMDSWSRNKEKILMERNYLQLGDSAVLAGNSEIAILNYQKAGEAAYDMYGNPNPEGYEKKKALEKIAKAKMTWSETGSLDKSLDELWNLSIGKFSDVKHAVEFTAFLESKISEQLLESAKADPKLALKIISMPKYGSFITPSVKGQVEVRIKEMVDQSNQLRDLAESMRVKKELFESKFMIIKNTGGYDAMGKPVITKSYPYGEMVYSKVLLIVDSLEASFKTAPSFELSVHQANTVIEVYEKMLSFSDDELKSISKELKKVNDIKAIRGALKL